MEKFIDLVPDAVKKIQSLTNKTPEIGIICGSGLAPLVDILEDAQAIPYADIPGFPECTVSGHVSNLVIGTLHGKTVAALQGRAHLYEGHPPSVIKTLIRTLKVLGCKSLIVTNATGSLKADVGPGSLVAISDHINFQFTNPLVGPNDDAYGPRFMSMENAYDADLRIQLLAAAEKLGLSVTEGIYLGVIGPSFETPAEIAVYTGFGADVVGMSTVADVIIARHCGLKVVAVSVVTNLAAGMNPTALSHTETLENANAASNNVVSLVSEFIKSYRNDD